VEKGTQRATAFGSLRVRDFALLWSGQTVSSLGDGIFTVALAIVTLEVDRRPSGIAYVFAARALPSVILSLVGGVVADRFSRRLVMLSSDIVRGLTVGLIAFLLARGELRLWELIVTAAFFGAADSFFYPASNAIMPELLDENLLVSGNALGQMSSQLTTGLIGPAVGGVVVAAIGNAWSFGFDALTFCVSVATLIMMRARPTKREQSQSPLQDAREGLRYVMTRRWLLYALLAACLANFFGMTPLSVLLPLFVRETLHASALDLGIVFASGGAAGIIASYIVARLGKPKHIVTATWLAYAASGVGITSIALAHGVVVCCVGVAFEVGLMVYGDVLFFAMIQSLVDREVLGRVSSLIFLGAFSLGPFGFLIGGLGATWFGVRSAIVLSGIISSAICLVCLVLPGARDPEREGFASSNVSVREQGNG
jgi:MFS transporter, DHA3 family, tetracycline resistance protein